LLLDKLAESISRSPSKAHIIKLLERKKFLTITEISKELKLHKSTVLRHVELLERNNLIQKEKAEIDRRMTLLSLTERGKKIAKMLKF